MRFHIHIDDAIMKRVDALAGPRGRSEFTRKALLAAVDHAERRKRFEKAVGGIADSGHEWDDDPAAWVRTMRRADPRRVG